MDGQTARVSFGVSQRTVERVRERLVQQGLEAALNRAKAKRVKSRRLDGEKEAHSERNRPQNGCGLGSANP